MDAMLSPAKGKPVHSQGTDHRVAVTIAGLRQVIGIPGSRDTFTLHVAGCLEIPAGAFVGVLGQTGCGKTTLLTVLGLLRGATPGSSLDRFEMMFYGEDVPRNMADLWRHNRSGHANHYRRKHLGFALQHGELLPSLTVAENIAFPLRMNGWSRKQIANRVDHLVQAFRLYRAFEEPVSEGKSSHPSEGSRTSSLAHVRINNLSGGQYQRVALARAIAHQPEFIFVDEPTASLNRGVARIALQQLAAMRSEDGARSTTFMVTHDEQFAEEFCDVIVRMRPLASVDEGAAGEVVFG